MVSGSEVTRLVNKFELYVDLLKHEQSKRPNIHHHGQQSHVKARFKKHDQALFNTMEDMGNPFLEQSDDLLVFDSRDIADKRVGETVKQIEQARRDHYGIFVAERPASREKHMTDTIKQNKLSLFSRQCPKQTSKEKQQILYLKQDCSLFSRLYYSC